MGRIHLLDDDVINKIAAGEVVERPVSVVKELVENAIDAGATSIEVSLEMGGVRSIAVTDDGTGMSPADAGMALRRHATSKLRAADDLFRISTMGFRGEALAAIAAVSRFSLATTERGQKAGVKLVVGGGEAPVTWPWNGPAGTTVVAENLFFNMPGRAKFLKAPGTEFSHCLELLQAFALCHPEIAFSLRHNGREQLSVPLSPASDPSPGPVASHAGVPATADGTTEASLPALEFGEASLTQRAKAVLGKDAAQLQYVSVQTRHGSLEALLSPPGVEKATGKNLFMFVNGRWVKDRVMRYGILRGYHSHLLKGRFPVAIVHLRLDPALVDVNVHPAKTEVRFQYPEEIQGLIARALREKLRDASWAGAAAGLAVFAPEAATNHAGATGRVTPEAGGYTPRSLGLGSETRAGGSAAEAAHSVRRAPATARASYTTRSYDGATRLVGGAHFDEQTPGQVAARASVQGLRPEHSQHLPVTGKADIDAMLAGESCGSAYTEGSRSGPVEARSDWGAPVTGASFPGNAAAELGSTAAEGQGELPTVIPWDELSYLGAYDRCYLLFSTDGKLLVVDQHAFHERILFERLSRDTALLKQSQKLLVPEALELSPTEVASLRARWSQLAARGFDFQAEGHTTVVVRAVPSLLAGCELGGLFSALGRDLSSSSYLEDSAPGADGALTGDSNAELARLILATAACHGAVRAGDDLPENELRQLLAQARTVDFYHNCPHGRRVFKWWNRAQVARWFDR